MTAQIIDGQRIAQDLITTLTARVKANSPARPPALAVILIGEDPASQVYVSRKRQACERTGIRSVAYDLPDNTTQATLLDLITQLNHDPLIDGILVQLPLPSHIDTQTIIEHILPTKDVDGFHPYNLGRLAARNPLLRPCTPYGIMKLLATLPVALEGLEAVIVGASNVVGRPMGLELLMVGCTVTTCHRFTRDLEKHVSNADLLVVAVGKPEFIPGNWIKKGAIVIDVGMNRLADGRLVGDIDFDGACKRAAWITPVPRGVGPMTVATLLENTILASQLHALENNLHFNQT